MSLTSPESRNRLILRSIHGEIKIIREIQAKIDLDIATIKVDVAHHIKRSDALEAEFSKQRWWLIGLMTSILLVMLSKVVTSAGLLS